MPKQENLRILSNREIGKDAYLLCLEKKEGSHLPGQFLHLEIPGFSLRRPLSVCDENESQLWIYYKKLGAGTTALSRIKEGELSCLSSCGNAFRLLEDEILLIGGGVGVAPLLFSAKKAYEMGKKIKYIFGFRSPEQAVFEEEMKKYGQGIYCFDSQQENVITVMKKMGWQNIPYLCCGPEPMMKAVYHHSSAKGQFSLECRMGCGFGACMGCSISTKNGNKRICKEGPVFESEELEWAD